MQNTSIRYGREVLPSVLLISNHTSTARCPGVVAALRELCASSEIGEVNVIHAGVGREPAGIRDERVVREVRASSADVLVVLSLKDAVSDMSGMARAIAGRPVLYWEGDPWGRGKRVSDAMRAWMELSAIVFSVGGEPQSGLLRRVGASDVRLIVHTYDHVLFAKAEKNFDWNDPSSSAGFVGSNLMRAPLVSGLPGSWQRFTLVRRVRNSLPGFAVAGPGWPPGWSQGAIPFADQVPFLRSCRLLTNWDHYPATRDYTSDRLAITMIAGRAQVSTLHPGMGWIAGEGQGVFTEATVDSAIDRTIELAGLPDATLRGLGENAHAWARFRMSHRNAYRYMLSSLVDSVAAPTDEPWNRLPTA